MQRPTCIAVRSYTRAYEDVSMNELARFKQQVGQNILRILICSLSLF